MHMSENMATFLKGIFTKSIANPAQLALKKSYDIPKVDTMKCPKMDSVMKSNTSKGTKDAQGTAASCRP